MTTDPSGIITDINKQMEGAHRVHARRADRRAVQEATSPIRSAPKRRSSAC
jgi:hypothetical protein